MLDKSTSLDLYCGINETKWNHHPVNPGPLVCISPVYGTCPEKKRENAIQIPSHCEVFEDSGAFVDGPGERLSFTDALTRQIAHAIKFRYSCQVKGLASYDLLIDEKWIGGRRQKQRWTESEAWRAVEETVQAARFLSENFHTTSRILSAQGVSAEQYVACTKLIMPWFDTGKDIFGLGGWCISGKMPKQMRPVFNETIKLIIPYLGSRGIRRVHIWGVTDVTFLGPLLWMCDQYTIRLSTDSSAPQRRPAFGHWGFRGWSIPDYKAPPVEVRGIHRAIHTQLMRQRLATLRQSEFYHHPDFPDGYTLNLGAPDYVLHRTISHSDCIS